MSNYTKSTDFASKDTLPSGDSAKIVRGTEIDAEFEALETAVNSKYDSLVTIPVSNGGTGATTASGARTSLGLVIGTDVQAYDSDLTTWAGKTAPAGDVVGTTDTQTLTNKTLTSPVINGMSSSIITSATSVASTSGTSIDFTSIPSWVKRITVVFNGVSTSGSSFWLLRLGTGGTPETTGYDSVGNNCQTSNTLTTSTAGFVAYANASAYVVSGSMVLTNISGNIWICSGLLGTSTGAAVQFTTTGTKTLGGILNMVRLTTVNGTDTFDAGSINILYE